MDDTEADGAAPSGGIVQRLEGRRFEEKQTVLLIVRMELKRYGDWRTNEGLGKLKLVDS